jgi:ribosomal protein S18 acetylase RimI-like enzyme
VGLTDFPDVPGLSLRSAEAGDQAFLDVLYHATRADLQLAGADPALIADLIKMQQRLHEHGQRSAFPHARPMLFEHAGQTLGRVVVDTDLQHGMRVVDIALLPQARNRGHGGAVLRALQRQAAALQLPLRLCVARDNAGARRLYRALGFELETAGEMTDELVWRAERAA